MNESKLTVKDLITSGIFSALIFICINISGGPLMMIPTLTFYYSVGCALLAGPVYLLMLAKVPKRGPIYIAGALLALFCLVTGMHIGMVISYIVCSVIADLIAATKKYKSVKRNIISYIIFSFGGIGTYVAFYINPSGWLKTMADKGTSSEYLSTFKAAGTYKTLIIMIIGTIVIGALSGFVGSKLLRKHFEKAGITA